MTSTRPLARDPTTPLPPENAYGHTKKLRFILDALREFRAEQQRPLQVMDFGCGNGAAVTRFLAAPDMDLHGVDIHAPSLGYARATFGGSGIHFHKEVPPDIWFDAIVYADVLEHLDDPESFVRDHVARLIPGGMVIGAIPNGYGPFEMEHRVNRILPLRHLAAGAAHLRRKARKAVALQAEPSIVKGTPLPYNHQSGHVIFFTRRRLRELLRSAGLTLTAFSHGSVFCGPFSTPLIRGSLVRANVRLADGLPYWAVSTWYFAARLPEGVGGSSR